MSHLSDLIANDLDVATSYRHRPKLASPGEPVETPVSLLKWYSLNDAAKPIPAAVEALARRQLPLLATEAKGLGFVLLHRCGEGFYFLIVGTWRSNNELWQSVFYKNGDAMAEFELFPREGVHKPTLCVWELGPVNQEKDAWIRFLSSPRDEAAGESWLHDRFSGAI